MQIISLNKQTLGAFKGDFLRLFPKRKLLIIKDSDDLNLNELQEIITLLEQRSIEYLFHINENSIKDSVLFENRHQLGIKEILITQLLDHPTAGVVSEKVYRDIPHITGASERLHEYGWRYPEMVFHSEIILEENNLKFIGPFAKYYFEKERRFLLLNPKDLPFEKANKVKEQLSYLQMYLLKKSGIYFSPDHPRAKNWEALTENRFKGPRIVDIDVANTCTHNCNFCGLYNDEIVAKHVRDGLDGKFQPPIQKQYQAKIPTDIAIKLINELPHGVEHLTFGGLGDPFTHPDIISFIENSLQRGFKTTAYSNYAYMSDEKIKRMHNLCSANPFSLHFIVNFSAAHASTYEKIRSNQNEKTFERVIKYLKLSSKLREKDGRGITFTLMSVTNAVNYQDMPDLVARAVETGALALWIKPMEIHGEHTLKYLITESKFQDYAYHARTTLGLADYFQIELRERNLLEQISAKYEGTESPSELAINWIKKSSLFSNLTPKKNPTIAELYHIEEYPNLMKWLPTTTSEIQVVDVEAKTLENSDKLGVMAAGLKGSFYDTLGCHIALEYVRIEVDGKVLPCCISNHALAQMKGESFFDIWTNGAFENFRAKMARIHLDKFHRTDPHWHFCEQCVHTEINREFHLHAGRKIR
jgi:MoaA/NifB/PqqE/SkfB family radical SAM enzyme